MEQEVPNSIRGLADWVTISSLATAGGTLVLAVATFGSVRSANRTARVAELSLHVLARGERIVVDLLYGDYEGGQRTITRFGVTPWADHEAWRAEVLGYCNLDREEPR